MGSARALNFMSTLIHFSPAVSRFAAHVVIMSYRDNELPHCYFLCTRKLIAQIKNRNIFIFDTFSLWSYIPISPFFFILRSRRGLWKNWVYEVFGRNLTLRRLIDDAFKANRQKGARRGSVRKYLFVRDIPRYILSALNGGVSKQWRGARCNRFSKAKGIREYNAGEILRARWPNTA